MRNITKKIGSILLILALVTTAFGGAFAGGAMAATTTLAGDGSDEVTAFTANETNDLEYSLASDGTDFDTDGSEILYMNVSYDGDEYAEVEAAVEDGTATSQTLSVTNDELSDLPGDAGQSTTVTVTAWGEDADGNVATPETSFDVDVTFDSSHSAVTFDDDTAEIEEQDVGFFSLNTLSLGAFGDSAEDLPEMHTFEETVGIDGANTEVTVTDGTSDGADAFDDAIGDDKEAGDLITGASASADGTPVLTFFEEADTDIVDEETDTYAVYDGSGTWTFNVGDDYEGETEMDVFVSSQGYTSVDSFESADLGSLFIESADMGMMDLGSEFGYLETFSSFSFSDLLPF